MVISTTRALFESGLTDLEMFMVPHNVTVRVTKVLDGAIMAKSSSLPDAQRKYCKGHALRMLSALCSDSIYHVGVFTKTLGSICS